MTIIILAFLACLVVSIIAVIVAFYALKAVIIEIVSSAIWSGFGIPLLKCSILSLLGFLTPLIIFPVTAYFISPSIYALQYDKDTTSEILFVFAGFPYFFLPIPIIYLLWLFVRKDSL